MITNACHSNSTHESYVIRSGREEKTTNNRMELSAVVYALEYICENAILLSGLDPDDLKVIIKCDSKYVTDNFNEQLLIWTQNGNKKKNGSKIENEDLWKRIASAVPRLRYASFEWVKGHSGDFCNTVVDIIARHSIGADKPSG